MRTLPIPSWHHLLPVAAALLGGCVAGVTTTKVAPGANPKGVRVHLPAPFIVGRPNPAGEIDWKVEYLPDPDEEYAVHAWAIMAKNHSNFTRTRSGLMKSATLDLDTSVVAAELAKTVGGVANAALETANTQRTNQRTAEATRKSNIVTLKASVRDKTRAAERAREDWQKTATALTAADQALAKAEQGGDAQAIKDAKANLVAAQDAELKARRALEDADRAVTDAQKALSDEESKSFDTGQAGGPAGKASTLVPGTVIYRIAEDAETGGIRLEPVRFSVFSFNGEITAGPSKQLPVESWGKKPAKKE